MVGSHRAGAGNQTRILCRIIQCSSRLTRPSGPIRCMLVCPCFFAGLMESHFPFWCGSFGAFCVEDHGICEYKCFSVFLSSLDRLFLSCPLFWIVLSALCSIEVLKQPSLSFSGLRRKCFSLLPRSVVLTLRFSCIASMYYVLRVFFFQFFFVFKLQKDILFFQILFLSHVAPSSSLLPMWHAALVSVC